jgi:hypothetical protein
MSRAVAAFEPQGRMARDAYAGPSARRALACCSGCIHATLYENPPMSRSGAAHEKEGRSLRRKAIIAATALMTPSCGWLHSDPLE